MEMTSQLNGSSLSQLQLLQQNSNRVLTESDELYIFKLLEDKGLMGKKLHCNCQYCLMEEVPFVAYKLARDFNRSYPETWDSDKKAGTDWIEEFKGRYINKISKFSSDCKIKLPLKSKKPRKKLLHGQDEIFTTNDEQLLLTQLRNMIEKCCICIFCIRKRIPFVAYNLARELHRNYPVWWDKNKKAGSAWFKNFKKNHKTEISKFSLKCEAKLFEAKKKQQSSSELVLTTENEILLLFRVLHTDLWDCKCKVCSLKKVQSLVYRTVRWKKLYPHSWDETLQADSQWMKKFEERYANEISEIFVRNCKKTSSQALTNLTLHDERWLLLQISVYIQSGCNCKSCVLKEVQIRVYEFVREYQKPYLQKWDENQQADSEWLKRFEIRHNREISKFPLECQVDNFFTPQEEEYFLLKLQLAKTQLDCDCKLCAFKHMECLVYARVYQKQKSASQRLIDLQWMKKFEEKYRDRIPKFSHECKLRLLKTLPQTIESTSVTVFTVEEENFFLSALKTIKTRFNCNCKLCAMKEWQYWIYFLAKHDYGRSYPPSWDNNQQADPQWLKEFEERHSDEISQFSLICNAQLS